MPPHCTNEGNVCVRAPLRGKHNRQLSATNHLGNYTAAKREVVTVLFPERDNALRPGAQKRCRARLSGEISSPCKTSWNNGVRVSETAARGWTREGRAPAMQGSLELAGRKDGASWGLRRRAGAIPPLLLVSDVGSSVHGGLRVARTNRICLRCPCRDGLRSTSQERPAWRERWFPLLVPFV